MHGACCEQGWDLAPFSVPHDTVGQLNLLMLLCAIHAADMFDIRLVR